MHSTILNGEGQKYTLQLKIDLESHANYLCAWCNSVLSLKLFECDVRLSSCVEIREMHQYPLSFTSWIHSFILIMGLYIRKGF